MYSADVTWCGYLVKNDTGSVRYRSDPGADPGRAPRWGPLDQVSMYSFLNEKLGHVDISIFKCLLHFDVESGRELGDIMMMVFYS